MPRCSRQFPWVPGPFHLPTRYGKETIYEHFPETAQEIAAHESSRTTKLYDRSQGEITLDEIERIPAV